MLSSVRITTMAESKLLEGDKDEWFYQSMKKYSNLYMFELESPLDALEILNETSLCVSGVQAYSKKCEILQLCVPPKLLSPETEEGLCKDRDFKILSGGYADGRIRQIKSIPHHSRLVATVQDEFKGVIIHEVGDDNRATILERCRLQMDSSLPTPNAKSLCCLKDRIILASLAGDLPSKPAGLLLNEWKAESYTSCNSPTQTYSIWNKTDELKCGQIVKMKEWDDNSCIFLTSTGTIGIYDFRTGTSTPGLFFHATKSENLSKPLLEMDTSTPETPPIIFTFDSVSHHNKIGVLDSCGGYEAFDSRFVGVGGAGVAEAESSSASLSSRTLLPEFSELAGVYPQWFNIEYEPWTEMRESEISRFVISGVKREFVPVFQEINVSISDSKDKELVMPAVFSHDGHTKPVTHAIWHPVAKNLIFSASADAVLHAWQFIPNKGEN